MINGIYWPTKTAIEMLQFNNIVFKENIHVSASYVNIEINFQHNVPYEITSRNISYYAISYHPRGHVSGIEKKLYHNLPCPHPTLIFSVRC